MLRIERAALGLPGLSVTSLTENDHQMVRLNGPADMRRKGYLYRHWPKYCNG